jgi:hypothetical protein
MKRNKKALMIILILVVFAAGAYAQNTATVRRTIGKVEIQTPGEAWRQAEVGMQVPLQATISTGFNSQAVLEIGGSVLTLRALTRIRIDELGVRDNAAVTGLSMPVGRIRAEVRSTEGLTTDFRVRSPVSTAAVRGTGFDDDGSTLFCFEDGVDFESESGLGTKVSEGETGKVDGLGPPRGGAPQRLLNTTVSPYTKGPDDRYDRFSRYKDALGRGRIVINWSD